MGRICWAVLLVPGIWSSGTGCGVLTRQDQALLLLWHLPSPVTLILDCWSAAPVPARRAHLHPRATVEEACRKGFRSAGDQAADSQKAASCLQGSARTSFRSGGNHKLVVCKAEGAVFPSCPPSCSEPVQALFPLPSLDSNPSLCLQRKPRSKLVGFSYNPPKFYNKMALFGKKRKT